MIQFPMQRIGVSAGFAIYNPFATTPTMHYAIDISRTQPETYNVFAANDGKVIMSLHDSAGGNMIAIQGFFNDKKDIITRYAHLAVRSVFYGDTVTRGQIIGIQGNTGTATTAQHLHFETWIVPKNYKYVYADRQKYAVDPLGVCQLLEKQIFLSDAETFNFQAIPYPDPKAALSDVVGGKVTIVGNVQMYLYPDEKYSPFIAGYNRSKKYVSDFFYDTVFPCTKTCSNNKKTWALITTARGDVWLPVIDGKSILTGAGPGIPLPPAGATESDEVARLKTELDAYKIAMNELDDIIKKMQM